MNFTVENASNFGILSSSPADSHAAKIVCKGLVGISFRNTSQVTMLGLTINSCGKCAVMYHNLATYMYAVLVHSGVDISITDCSFQESFGTALGVFYSSVDLTGKNSFTKNCQVCSERSHNCVCLGGGIHTSRSNLTFIGSSTFRNNSALDGGGIYALSSSLNFIGNSAFRKNSAEIGGGIHAETSALNFTGSIAFRNNSAEDGGGIHTLDSTLNFIGNNMFSNNSAAEYGGAIIAWTSTLNFIGNSTFSNNSAEIGGGIYAETSILNFAESTTFRNNSAVDGGGIYALNNITLNFIGNSMLCNNSAGAIIAWTSTLSFIGNSTFSNNFGGGIYAEASTLNFIGNSMFGKNSAEHGGAIVAWTSTLNFSGNSTFMNNSATSTRGGGIFAKTSSMNFIGTSTFISNSAAGICGGGVYAQTSTLRFNGISTFWNNSAEYGGAIMARTSTLNFTGSSTFRNNSAEIGGGIHAETSALNFTGSIAFRNNSAEDGGGISILDSNLSFIGNSTFSNNSAVEYGGEIAAWTSTLKFNGNSTFNNSSAEIGGGIYAVTSILNFTGSTSFRNNSAVDGGGIYALNNSTLTFIGNSMLCNNSAEYGGAIIAWTSTLNFIGDSTFSNNSGGGIYAENSTLNIIGSSTFMSNSTHGGGIFAKTSSMNFIGTSIFISNSAVDGGGIHTLDSTLNFIGNSMFSNNSADYGGAIAAFTSTLNFNGNSTFSNNSAEIGGGIYAETSILNFAESTTFWNNSAVDGGGIHTLDSTLNFIGNSMFSNNSADYGGAIAAFTSTLNFNGNSTFSNNSAEIGGGIYAETSILNFSGDSTFSNNSAKVGGGIVVLNSTLNVTGSSNFRNNSAVSGTGGGIEAGNSALNFNGNGTFGSNYAVLDGGGINIGTYSTLRVTGNCVFRKNSAKRFGGGIKIFRYSTIEFTTTNIWTNGSYSSCTVCFTENSALIHGGAIYTADSTLSFQGSNAFRGNSALQYAGGIYSRNSTLKFSGNTCFRSNIGCILGGGIYGLGTALYFSGSSSFTANTAAKGGGEYLSNSFNFLSKNTSVTMNNNNATEYGGAVYVDDFDPISYCFSDLRSVERCFFQVTGLNVISNPKVLDLVRKYGPLEITGTTRHAIDALVYMRVHFYNNHAQIAGSAVYGGSVDNCVTDIEYKSALSSSLSLPSRFLSFIFLKSNLELEPNSVSSHPFQVCLCEGGIPNCNIPELVRQVYPGELLHFSVVTAGQRDGIVPAVVQAFFSDSQDNASLGQFQTTQTVKNDCTELFYQMHSSVANSSNTLVLYADGPCSTDGKLLNISVQFLPCPHGFSLNLSEGICGCEWRLQKYTTRCNITERTITREGEFWVGYDNHSQALILQPFCPFDYCKPATEHISFPLNNTDSQCENSRSGLLCGGCTSGFSLALGSSKCLQCSNVHILLLIPFALAGIALVLLLIVFKLTVAAGTINGLIFYANIVAVNRAVFFPPNQTNILTVFIAWLNLDLGFETCFFDGMDAYLKTWLQFVFPLYVWSLVALIIIGSEYSSRIARVFGSNPVAVLATLFLLSYAKLLRTIIAALYFTFLDYPNGLQIAVWLYDGNVRYLCGKHIALLLVAVLAFLIFFLPYTLLLTVGQCLQGKSNRKVFSWINKPRMKPFLDAYQAPYRDQCRYWIGLMLCLRCILFLVFAFNVEANPSLNLLAIEVVVIGLLTLIHFVGLIYKKLYLDIIEASFILNLGILAAATFYVRQVVVSVSQAAVTYTSVGVAFTTFVGVLLYHMYQQVRPKLQQKIYGLCHHKKASQGESFDEEARTDNQDQFSITPTITIVERPIPEPLNFIELREPLISSEPCMKPNTV